MQFLIIFLPVLAALQVNGWLSIAIILARSRRKQKREAEALAKLFGDANDRQVPEWNRGPDCPCPACVSRRDLRVN